MKATLLAIDLFCGSFGWTAGLLELGGRVVGFDIEHEPHHGPVPRGADLVLQDVRSINGAQFAGASLILASSPCQEFSYRAMPWKRAKALGPPLLGMELFAQAERIQREAIAAAGRFIPMVQENVRGAQKYVGRARWHYGSFYLWGNVPALMPITLGRTAMKEGISHRSNGATDFHGNERAEGFKTAGMGWSNRELRGQDFTRIAAQQAEGATKNDGGSWFNVAHNTESGTGQNPDGRKTAGHANQRDGFDHTRHLTSQAESDAVKIGGEWFREAREHSTRKHSSGSRSRKAASARIAKIPLALSRHIARVYFPKG